MLQEPDSHYKIKKVLESSVKGKTMQGGLLNPAQVQTILPNFNSAFPTAYPYPYVIGVNIILSIPHFTQPFAFPVYTLSPV